MDIDAQIRDILMKSTPVNDNFSKQHDDSPTASHNWGISVVGNQNVIINAGLFQLFMMTGLFLFYLSVLH